MSKPLPYIPEGTTFGHWTVTNGKARNRYPGRSEIECRCACGTVKMVLLEQLRHGNSKSCGCYDTRMDKYIASFWAKGVKRENGCLEWSKGLNQSGYGLTTFKAKPWTSHRLSYLLTYGEIPEGMLVCHRCDNPKCFNPEHLFLGTTQDNSADCVSKNRQAKGERSNSKLTPRDVLAIRALRAEYGFQYGQIADLFRVSDSLVEQIIHGQKWKHVDATMLDDVPLLTPTSPLNF